MTTREASGREVDEKDGAADMGTRVTRKSVTLHERRWPDLSKRLNARGHTLALGSDVNGRDTRRAAVGCSLFPIVSSPESIAANAARARPFHASLAGALFMTFFVAGCGGGGDDSTATAVPAANESQLETPDTRMTIEATTTVPVPPAVCTPPVAAVSTSSTAASVGNGTAASCTESALRAAIASKSRSIVTFNCGAAPVTIPIAAEIALPTDRNLVIDGGNKVTLDGGHRTRLFSLVRQTYRSSNLGVTLQHIALANAKAPGTGYVPQDPTRPQCAWGYAGGGGAGILVRDAVLHVIDVQFTGNAAASPGPDVAGGAIYAIGSLDVTVVGSRFVGNSGSNGGAVGLLQSNGRLVNSTFDGNSATGIGANYVDASCAGVGHSGQAGAGGLSGAIGIDGADDTDQLVCGSTFTNNKANEMAGALARTVNGAPRHTTIDRSTFAGNTAKQAGAVYVVNSRPMEILASTFSANTATKGFGAAQLDRSLLKIENSTFAGNQALAGVGGALELGGNDAASSIRNVTFANNRSPAGSGYFSAAIFGQLNFPVNNTVFSNNLTNDAGSPMQCTFTPGTGAADMQWPRNHVVGGAPDTLCVTGIVFADPLLGALASNGGPTQTLLPAATSPLRHAGRNCPATDQRGQPRSATTCTIGAVE
jgi:hypothetical protein